MNANDLIIVTGAAGFIASNVVRKLNSEGFENIILVDDFSKENKKENWQDLKYVKLVDRLDFLHQIMQNSFGTNIQYIIHLGARTDTTEMDYEVFQQLNLDYSKAVWNFCSENNIALIYASSAATYGNGEAGYDDHTDPSMLAPLNPYGVSKNEFDKWILKQNAAPPHWYGLKFFNVYGPYENQKGRMASVIFHAFNQINEHGNMKLFKSHKPEFKDGEQLRDFVYVEDVCNIIFWLCQNSPTSGIYNLGTGEARTFLDLAKNVFQNLQLPENIEFIDIPEDIRFKYQYYTQADMQKLKEVGYSQNMNSLEVGIEKYMAWLKKTTV